MIRAHQPPLSVASLPATGYDGQEVFLDTGAAAEVPHYRWSAAAARWQLVTPPAPACRVYRTTNQAVPNNSWTAISFLSERFDPTGMHSPGVNPSRVTISETGVYVITSSIQIAGNSTGQRQVRFRVNGSTEIAVVRIDPPNANSQYQTISTVWYLAAGDYVETMVYQNSGGSLNVEAVNAVSPEMAVARISGGGESVDT